MDRLNDRVDFQLNGSLGYYAWVVDGMVVRRVFWEGSDWIGVEQFSMKTISKVMVLAGMLATAASGTAGAAASIEVVAVNRLERARVSETIEVPAAELAVLGVKDLWTVRVKDAKGVEFPLQAIDTDGDPLRSLDAVIFQADFAAGETKRFTLSAGAKQVFKPADFKAYGRFNRERFDDFIWENDRIAHRTYGKALETWEGEPLTSSTIDIWSKRTPRMVVNEWYMSEDYHADHGEGADFYSAGPSRGCGGGGLWAADRMWTSRNFIHSKVLACGPIRVMFELEYAPYDVNGVSVVETKRVTLDAGHQFNRYQVRYKPFTRPGQTVALSPVVGLKKVAGESVAAAPEKGWLAKWEAVEKKGGQQGLAMIVPASVFEKQAEDALNHLLVTRSQVDRSGSPSATWWAGFCWDKAGHFTTADAWKDHVAEYAEGLVSPIEVTISKTN